MKKTRSFLKWAGNKYNCLNHMLPFFPKAQRLIEPFAGSGAVFMNTQYDQSLLAEENRDLISLFHHLQQEGDVFIEYCEQFFTQNHNVDSQYYQFREQFNQTTDTRLRAGLFLYLNRHGFNGLCRYNQQGIYNVPFGRYTKPYFPRIEMQLFHQKSQQATFIHRDFRDTFALALPGDFIYCDPPYAPLDQESNFSAYMGHKFSEVDQMDLATAARDAARRGIRVVISNHDTPFTRQQYQGAEIISFSVARVINSDITRRFPAQEIIAIF